jgi:hypothetical protein
MAQGDGPQKPDFGVFVVPPEVEADTTPGVAPPWNKFRWEYAPERPQWCPGTGARRGKCENNVAAIKAKPMKGGAYLAGLCETCSHIEAERRRMAEALRGKKGGSGEF